MRDYSIISLLTFIASIVAVLVSYYFNKSIEWAIFHFFLGWIYLLYCLVIGRFVDGKLIEIISSYF